MENTNYKLGKLAVKKDNRNIKFKKLLIDSNLPILPSSFDVDSSLNNIESVHMYANDRYGCCVITGRAHMTLRFEAFEQDIIIPITDKEVINAYFHESGGVDSGLVVLDSLKSWRSEGWIAGGKPYNIYAFAQIAQTHHEDVMYAIYLLNGCFAGFALPNSAKNQIIWGVDDSPNGEVGSWGGHLVYIKGYNNVGPICITWGEKKQMTWAFWNKYCDEAYAIIDNKNVWIDPETNPLNCEYLQSLLEKFNDYPISPPNTNPPTPPVPPINESFLDKIINFFKSLWKNITNLFK
jgi:hypothetical protein